MKLKRRWDEQDLTIQMSGHIEGERCACLQHYWQRHVAEATFSQLKIEMVDVDEMDAAAIAVMVDLISAARRAPITLDSAPQMLAHTLYKTAMLEDGRIRLINEVQEEPYAG